MKRKAHIILLVLLLLCVLSTTAFAIDESEVESAIAASSKEEVAGNVFIWFLCAIGFLKVSQKIDSFMASLGINVGRTGGSMLTELMVAGRGIAAVAGAVGGTVFNHHSSSNSTHTNAQAAGAAFTGGGNGLVGVTRRAAGNAAAASATGNAKGLSNLVGGAMFEASLQNGGKFAMSVVGAVAKGSISSVGSITGDQAAEALTSYLGYSPVDSGSALADDGGLIPPSPITSEDVVTLDGGTAAGTASPTASANGTPIPSGAREHDGSVVESARISGAPPIFQNVEIGGGRITGLEVSPDRQSDTKPPEQLGIRIKQPRKKRKRPTKTEKQLNKNNRKMVPSHKKQVTYSEDFVPVKDIRNGIIETEDGRYIKVLEVEPINFLLRSTSEQKNIVASFASWMKISPIKIQIKVLTKKADIGKHLSTIERDMESESNPKCRELQLDYYRLIRNYR